MFVFARLAEGQFVQMGGKNVEIVDSRIFEGQFIEMHGEGFVVLRIDFIDRSVKLHIADAA